MAKKKSRFIPKTKGGKKKLSKYEQRILPTNTGWVKIHIPDKDWEEVSWCHKVSMVWQHLICYPKTGESKSALKALRVCESCVDQAAEHFDMTD